MNRRIALTWKRIFDVLVSFFLLLLLSPIMILIALLIWLTGGAASALFRQQRPGLQGQPFVLLKFRTMTHARDEHGELLPDTARLTSLGKFLRSSSLDELPELLNVLKGEMSLVGPRPLLMHYLNHYTAEQMRRHEVKPGITGWAQINGRNALTWEERFDLDVWYVEHWNLRLDFVILIRTLFKVVKREGISAEGHATMPEFKKSKG